MWFLLYNSSTKDNLLIDSIKKEDVYEGVNDIITIGDFYKKSEGGENAFYIKHVSFSINKTI